MKSFPRDWFLYIEHVKNVSVTNAPHLKTEIACIWLQYWIFYLEFQLVDSNNLQNNSLIKNCFGCNIFSEENSEKIRHLSHF